MTSPSYDPDNIPDIAGDETGAYDGVYLNRFFDAAYTPGSIFKLVTSAAALEQSASAQTETHTCTGKTIIGGQEIVCMSSHGTLAMPEALAHSCNVYYGELASALGKDALQAACDKLGLNGTLTCDGYTARRPSICQTRMTAASPGPGSASIPTRSRRSSSCALWA